VGFEASLCSVPCYPDVYEIPRLQSSHSTTLHPPVEETLCPNRVSQGVKEKFFALVYLIKRCLKSKEFGWCWGEEKGRQPQGSHFSLQHLCIVPTMPPMWGAFLGKLSLVNVSTNSKCYQRFFFLLSSAFLAFFTDSFCPFLCTILHGA